MGNSTSHQQDTWKICMICNRHNRLNTDLMLLNRTLCEQRNRKQLLLRCNMGHILLYEGNIEHIDFVTRELISKEESKTEIDKLKQEISLLKEEIEFLKNNPEPSAPPLSVVELI